MPNTVIEVENLTKEYKLGQVNYGMLMHDIQSWWAHIRGKEDPNSIITKKHSNFADRSSILAVDKVSFSVSKGKVFGIIGNNGAGKSTLLKILARITTPTAGSVKMRGRVGSILQVGTGFHPDLTGRENIYLNGAILGMKKKEIAAKEKEIILFSELGKYADTPVKRYSKGMYVRLAFSIIVHFEPEILLIDEVLSVGDVHFRKKCLEKMKDFSKTGHTEIFVSHNMDAITYLCDEVMLLENGKIKEIGSPASVVDNYLNQMASKS
jgi:lipopolysaccharide transport system ATP-binding protein